MDAPSARLGEHRVELARLLEKKGAAYEEVDVMMDEKMRAEMRERAKRSTVPQIFINGQYVGGSDELAALELAGKLDTLLTQPG